MSTVVVALSVVMLDVLVSVVVGVVVSDVVAEDVVVADIVVVSVAESVFPVVAVVLDCVVEGGVGQSANNVGVTVLSGISNKVIYTLIFLHKKMNGTIIGWLLDWFHSI